MPSLKLSRLLRLAGSSSKKKTGGKLATLVSTLKRAGTSTKQVFGSKPVVAGSALTIGLAGIAGLSYAGYQWSNSSIHIGSDETTHSSQAGGAPPGINGPQGTWPPYY